MRTVAFASLLTVWGAWIVLNRLLGNVDTESAAQNVAFVLGVVMVLAGIAGLVRHRHPSG